ncbi:Uncharacterised protein [Mycobacterium tuberculosis]|nr:Uncharacterised protein [Mycobacterium tuberculosis]
MVNQHAAHAGSSAFHLFASPTEILNPSARPKGILRKTSGSLKAEQTQQVLSKKGGVTLCVTN